MVTVKRLPLTLILIIHVSAIIFGQQIEENFYIHDNENTFYLQMKISEVYEILGNPKRIQKEKHPRFTFNIVSLEYQGICFEYFDFYEDPQVLTIIFTGACKNYQIGNKNVIGLDMTEIKKEYGNKYYIRTNEEYIYYRYEFNISNIHHFELQFRFNSLDVCDEAQIIHSLFFI